MFGKGFEETALISVVRLDNNRRYSNMVVICSCIVAISASRNREERVKEDKQSDLTLDLICIIIMIFIQYLQIKNKTPRLWNDIHMLLGIGSNNPRN